MIDGESVNEILESMRASSTQCAGYALRLQCALDDQELIAKATQPPDVGVDVTDEMVERYVAAVNEHLASLSPKDWEIERFDPEKSIAKVARIGLTAALRTGGGE